MASLGIGISQCLRTFNLFDESPLRKNTRPSSRSFFNNKARGRKRGGISMSMAISAEKPQSIWADLEFIGKWSQGDKEAIAIDTLDKWMRESVVEIVKKLPQAPLLVQMYSDRGETRLKTEKKVVEENWANLKEQWAKKETSLPQGVMFVDELYYQEDSGEGKREAHKVWGIVVQGKGVDKRPLCYLLETSSVGSDLGLLSTHFILLRVNSFRETARSQLKNCWLLQPQ